MMHAIVLVFTFHLAHAPRSRAASNDRWFGADKAKHFFAAAFLQSASFGTLRAAGVGRTASRRGATVASSAISVGKELWDRRTGGDPSLEDLVWDAAGIAAASVLVARTGR